MAYSLCLFFALHFFPYGTLCAGRIELSACGLRFFVCLCFSGVCLTSSFSAAVTATRPIIAARDGSLGGARARVPFFV